MGWTFWYGDRADLLRDRTKDSEYVSPKDGSRHTRLCLAKCVRGNILWTVWELIDTPKDGEAKHDRYIGCDILCVRKDEVGYKDMCESMGPYYYSCPLSYLEMVPVSNKEWRESVRHYHAKHSAKGTGIKVGDTVKLIDGITVHGFPVKEAVIKSIRPLRCAAGPFCNVRISWRHIKTDEPVVVS